MPIEPRDILETYFETGDIPTAEQFKDLLDSYVHQTDDGVTIFRLPVVPPEIYFGIGIDKPQSRLGVKAIKDQNESAVALYENNSNNASWYVSLKKEGNAGLSFDETTAIGTLSRLFISKFKGAVGIGTTTPTQKLEIKDSTPGSITGIKLINTATLSNGVFIGNKQNSDPIQDGALSIYTNSVSTATERFTILQNGKTGVGLPDPDVTFHTSTNISDPSADLALIAGTGIMVVGPMTNNVGFDYRGFQARQQDPVTLAQLASTLNLNRLGGNVLIHGDVNNDVLQKIIFTSEGSFGVGTITPSEKAEIAGALKIGTTITENDGTIRFTGIDFEGFMNTEWVSLTKGMGPWKDGTPDGAIYYKDGTISRVGIGIGDPDNIEATLDINDEESVDTGNTAVAIHNHSQTTSSVIDDHRIGLQILVDGPWGGTPESKNIGLYIPDVTGHSQSIAIAAKGNVLIGELISGQNALGTGAKNTLAIRSSTAPSTTPDADTIQIFSAAGGPALPASVFNVKLGDGNVIKLYKGAALPPKNTNPVTDTYTSVEAGVLRDTRDRLDALETFLQTLGFLA